MLTPLANVSSIHRRPSVKWPCIHQNSHSDHPILAAVSGSPCPSSHAIAARTLSCSVSSLLSQGLFRVPLTPVPAFPPGAKKKARGRLGGPPPPPFPGGRPGKKGGRGS